jgi:hypothetical protein
MIPCPQEPPLLTFVRALHEGRSAAPMHELSFKSLDWKKAKPEGAVRLELFVDLVAPDEPIPAHPGTNYGGRPWYWRSYTRSPIVIVPPIARVPMRVLYWGRWADSTGETGPFCNTCVGWIEGGSHAWLPGGVKPVIGDLGAKQPAKMIEQFTDNREVTIRVAVMEVQRQAMMPSTVVEGTKQLEGPAGEDARKEAA